MSFETELDAFRAYAEDFRTAACCWWTPMTPWAPASPMPSRCLKRCGRGAASPGHPPGLRRPGLSQQRGPEDAGRGRLYGHHHRGLNDLDEHLIRDLEAEGARIDLWGVGTMLITSAGRYALGGVYKMSALEGHGQMVPKMKLSDNPEKITLPGAHRVYRLYDRDGKAIADLITLKDENIDFTRPLTIFHPQATWKKMHLTEYSARKLLEPLFRQGSMWGPTGRCQRSGIPEEEEASIWEQHLRLVNTEPYKVDLSDKLWELKAADPRLRKEYMKRAPFSGRSFKWRKINTRGELLLDVFVHKLGLRLGGVDLVVR